MIESDRTVPASVEAERAILGVVFLDNSSFFQTERLSADDFSQQRHGVIYRAMCSLDGDGRPIDFVTVTEVLAEQKQLDNAGGLVYVTNLTDGLPRVKNIESYVSIVLEKSRRRKFIQLTAAALEEAYDNSGSIEELIVRTERSFQGIGLNQKSEPKHIGEIIHEADSQVERDDERRLETGLIGCPTGVAKLDSFTTGYRRREVTVIAGETSDGKSALMKQSILANVPRLTKQLIFSREVSRVSLTLDFKAHAAQVYSKHVREGSMDLIERAKFSEINKVVKQWPIWIDDSRDLHIDDLVSKARRFVREQRKKPEDELIVWMDYVQLMRGKGRNRTEEIEDICAGLWGLADAENIPVVALSQLNYGEDKKEKKPRPSLRRLKGASRIEQDAHTLIFVYQPVDDRGQRKPEESELIVAKQRNGPTGPLYVRFDTDTLMFTER